MDGGRGLPTQRPPLRAPLLPFHLSVTANSPLPPPVQPPSPPHRSVFPGDWSNFLQRLSRSRLAGADTARVTENDFGGGGPLHALALQLQLWASYRCGGWPMAAGAAGAAGAAVLMRGRAGMRIQVIQEGEAGGDRGFCWSAWFASDQAALSHSLHLAPTRHPCRGQLLARTVRGMMCYRAAVRLHVQLECPRPPDVSPAAYEGWVEALVGAKFQYVCACQVRAQSGMAGSWGVWAISPQLASRRVHTRIGYA